GLLHLVLAPVHLSEGTASGAFFVVAALAQLVMAAAVVAWPAPQALRAAGAFSVAMVVVYVVFRLIPAPGTDVPEDFDVIGLVTQALQLLAAAACFALRRGLRPAKLVAS
ncbi:MAG: hypothetical protein ACRD0Q_03710, partial [Acidimicrobiales bacterium]